MAEMDPGFHRDDDEDRLLPIPKTTRKGILGMARVPFRKCETPAGGRPGFRAPSKKTEAVFASSRGGR